VLAETDEKQIEQKSQELENALFIRAQEIPQNGGNIAERESMRDATNKLLRVKIEKLGYPIDPKYLSDVGSGRRGNCQAEPAATQRPE
jgi:hypothetical protein